MAQTSKLLKILGRDEGPISSTQFCAGCSVEADDAESLHACRGKWKDVDVLTARHIAKCIWICGIGEVKAARYAVAACEIPDLPKIEE